MKTDECSKCLPRGVKVKGNLTMTAACDLRPMDGFSGPCALKFYNGIIDEDDGGAHKKPEKREQRRKGKARPNSRVRAERADKS